MNLRNMSEIRRPVRDIRGERIRQTLSAIEKPKEPNKEKNNKQRKFAIQLLISIVIFFILLFGISSLVRRCGRHSEVYNKAEWQAVFLSDGQVYFGKVVAEDKLNIILRNIYYLQKRQALQEGAEDINKQTGNFALIKLGNEIHGPLDEMRINRQHVLFIEDLKGNSKVVKAIENYQQKK